MNDKANEILKKIETKKIKPKSKWFFVVKDYLFWFLFFMTTLVGSVAISVIIFIINDNDWDIYKYLNKNFWSYFLILIPYFWIVILIILSLFAYFNYCQTRKGYLLNPYLLIFGSILVSIILGWILFAFGASEKIDKIFANKIPYYKNTEMHKNVFWNNPEKGLLAGEILEIKDNDNFLLMDLENNKWQIIGNDILWKEKTASREGEKIKLIGKTRNSGVFVAKEIRPWGCGCDFCDKDNNNHDSCNIREGREKGFNKSRNCDTH